MWDTLYVCAKSRICVTSYELSYSKVFVAMCYLVCLYVRCQCLLCLNDVFVCCVCVSAGGCYNIGWPAAVCTVCLNLCLCVCLQGAAIEDGRLRPGDRLLEIDGAEVTGLSQQQVVQLLRSVSPGQTVQLVLSRHEQPEERRTEEEPQTQRTAVRPGERESGGRKVGG